MIAQLKAWALDLLAKVWPAAATAVAGWLEGKFSLAKAILALVM